MLQGREATRMWESGNNSRGHSPEVCSPAADTQSVKAQVARSVCVPVCPQLCCQQHLYLPLLLLIMLRHADGCAASCVMRRSVRATAKVA